MVTVRGNSGVIVKHVIFNDRRIPLSCGILIE